MHSQPNVVIVTGMSGAGRSTAANVLEDLGYDVVDNIPPALIVELVREKGIGPEDHLAVVVDVRGGISNDLIQGPMYNLRGLGLTVALVFLAAADTAIVHRYEENRRPHPLERPTLRESISDERDILEEVRAVADVVIDTTAYTVHDLRDRIQEQFQNGLTDRPMRISVTSFGFKHGPPGDVDLQFDVRFFPNPHWVPELRNLVGTDEPVAQYVLGQPDAEPFLTKVRDFLGFLVPRYVAEGKSYLALGFGCTGGHHRSVAVAEEIARWCRAEGWSVSVWHRDRDR